MKQFVLIVGVLLAFMLNTNAQTTVFSEDFEGSTYDVTSSSLTGSNAWGLNSSYQANGLYCDSASVGLNDTTYLTTSSFSTAGNNIVTLSFNHICKIDWTDAGYVQVSVDNGVTWTDLTGSQYQGSGQFGNIGNAFAAHSYVVDWDAYVTTTIPNSSWWKQETFNISAIAGNQANVKVRFALADEGNAGGGANYGWLLDDIKVTVPSLQEATAMSYSLPLALPSGCGLGNEVITMKILNSGGQIINGNLTASFQREGLASVSETVTQSIGVADSITYTFATPIDLSTTVDTSYQVKVWVHLTGDPNQTNDTLTDDSVKSRIPLADPVISDVTIPWGDSILLHAIHTDTIVWYTDPLAQNQLKFGQYFQTPALFDTTVYYCQGTGALPMIKLTETVQYKTGTGATSPYPTGYPSGDFDGVELTNLGNGVGDLGGYTINVYNTATYSYTFPTGTTIYPGSTVTCLYGTGLTVGPVSAGVFNINNATNISSSTNVSYWITDANGVVVDAFAANAGTFPATSTVTAADFSSNLTGGSGKAGAVRILSDNNIGSDWQVTGTATASFGSMNSQLPLGAGPSTGASACPSKVKKVTVMISGIPQQDAGLTLVTPDGSVVNGTVLPIQVDLKNYGVQNLTKCSLNYSINGVTQPGIAWTGLIKNDSTEYGVTIGTETFNSGVYKIKAWSSLPNDSADVAGFNDTTTSFVYVCLSGTFTLGGPSADFTGFAELQVVLDSVGLCGATTIKINTNVYNEQLRIGNVLGTSDSTQLTFESASGLNTDVTIKYAASSTADNYVIKLDGSQYVNFKNITIEADGATYAYGVHLTNGAKHNTFDGNIIKSNLTTSGNGRCVVFYTGTVNEFNTISNNEIIGGYYALYIYGVNTTTRAHVNVIKDNNIHGFGYSGMYLYYQDRIEVTGNYIHDGLNATQFGIYTYYIYDGFNISNNKIVLDASNYSYGLRVYYANYNNLTTSLGMVANNMVSITAGTGANYGLYAYYSNRTYFIHNSVNIESGSATSRALHQYNNTTGNGTYFKNNSFVSKAGYAAYFQTPAAIAYQDHNNYYSTGAKFVRYNTTDETDLSALQASSSAEGNSVSADPAYISATDLHANSVNIDGKAAPDSLITMDYDGDLRSLTTPDIGADEFILLGDDAGILAMTSPVIACPGDTSDVIVTLRNYGTDTIHTAIVNWNVNSTAQTAYSYSGTLLPGQTANILVGTFIFQAGTNYSLDFWSTLPNGIADLQTSNDSLVFPVFKTSLPSGTYTIGSSATADYVDFASAITDLNAFGICGPVVFDVEVGTYAGNISIGSILGANSTNTITFQSINGDSTSVIVNSASGINLTFDGSSYITFKGISFISTASKGVAFKSGAHHNSIENCIVQIPLSTSNAAYVIDLSTGSNENYNSISNNVITGGYTGIYARGSSSTSTEIGTQIIGNTITDYYYYGIYAYYTDTINIAANTIRNAATSGISYGIYVYYVDESTVANNMVTLNSTSTKYGLYAAYGYNCDYVYNSVVVRGAGISYAARIYGYNGHSVMNNNFIALGTGTNYAIYGYGGTAYPLTSDYNNLYVSSGSVGYWSGAKATLAAWQTATGQDSHSYSVLPTFFGTNDLHTISSLLNAKGTPLADYLYDIDGEMRNATTPDIGADEFNPPAQEAALVSILSSTTGCGLDTLSISVQIANYGMDTIDNNLMAFFQVDGGTIMSETVLSTIYPGDTLTFTFSNDAIVTSLVDSTMNFVAWLTLSGDPLQLNDTNSIVVFNGVIPPGPTVTNPTVPYGTNATFTATSTHNIFWFNNLNAAVPNGIGTSYTYGPLFSNTDVYTIATASNGCASDTVTATATITGIPAGDVGISDIYTNSGCGLGTTETIAIDIYNQGTGTVNANLSATFKVDNNPWVTLEAVTTPIPSGDTIQYVFTATADLYALANDTLFKITAAVTLTGDPYSGNDTLFRDSIESKLTPLDPTVVTPVSIAYGAFANVSGTSNDTVYWYENIADTVAVGSGFNFNWPTPKYVSDTVYAQAGGLGGPQIIITECNLNADHLEIQNMSGGVLDATGWKVVVSLNYTNINDANSITQDIGVLQSGEVKYWTDASGNNYWGNNIMWNNTSPGWAMIIDDLGNVVDFVAWSYNASAIAGQSASINGFTGISGGSVWLGNGLTTFSADVISRISYDMKDAVEWTNVTTANLGIANLNMVYTGGAGGGSSCASNKVPVVINVAPPPLRDVGLDSIEFPYNNMAVQAGVSTPITVRIKNYGTQTLTTTSITYQLNGTTQGTYTYNRSLAFNATDTFTLTNDVFNGGINTIKLWATGANGTTQAIGFNDTTSSVFVACLSGTYDVAGGNNDFTDIPDAVNALDAAGICGNVIFNLYPDTVNAQVTIGEIAGTDSMNTVIFRSVTGDSTDVLIQYSPTSATDNYVLGFNKSRNITFDGISINSLGSTYNYGVYMTAGTEYCAIKNSHINSGTTSNSNGRGVVLQGGNNNFNLVSNNYITNAYYGIYLYGSGSASRSVSNIVTGNEVNGFGTYGIYIYYQDSVIINENKIVNGTNTSQNGIYSNYTFNGFEFNKNNIVLSPSSSAIGLRVSYGNYYPYVSANAKKGIVSNNIISIYSGTSTCNGLYAYYNDDVEYYYNSVSISGGSVSSRALYQYNTTSHTIGQTFINNIFEVSNGGHAAYFSTPAAINGSDYNNYYATGGTNFVYYSGNKANLAALKTASSDNAHSLSVNPEFISVLDLHINSIDLNGSGTNVPFITDDIDGDTRPTNPDMGADEYTPAPNDAGIFAITNPISPVTVGLNDIKVTLKNYGSDTLTSVTIDYILNNNAGMPYSWTGALDIADTIMDLVIGNANFTAGANVLKAWTSLPNGLLDGQTLNDTANITLIGCNGPLHGTYTIGGTLPDFPDFSSAAQALNYCGVDSHVVFLASPGTYTEQFTINTIVGAADTATVTFTSALYDSTSVILSRPSFGANYTMSLDGASYLRFKHLTIESLDDAYVIEMKGGSKHNLFESNVLRATVTTSSASAVIYSKGGTQSDNTFRNNSIENGYYGVYFYGTSSSVLDLNNTFENNSITGYYYYGMYLYYQKNLLIENNLIEDGNATYGYGLYLYYCDESQISNNKLNLTPSNYHYGIRLYYCDGTTTNPVKVFNNFISITSGTGLNYGSYIGYSTNLEFSNNSILITHGSSTTKGIYQTGGSSITLLNNNVVSSAYTLYINTVGAITSSDYNNLYATGSLFAYWGGAQIDLTALQTASGKDANSVSADPQYYSNTDLHVTSPLLNDVGTVVSYITTDIDGDARSTSTPDIGADEFTPATWDVIASVLVSPREPFGPQNTPITVKFKFKNIGLNTITSMTVGFNYNGTVVNQAWTGSLAAGAETTHTFGGTFTALQGYKNLKVFTSLPNDANTSNDTLFSSFTGVPMVVCNYREDFEIPPFIWAQEGSVWEHGAPMGSTINTAQSGSNAWVTNLTGTYPHGVDAYLYTPYFDFTTDTGMVMSFYHYTDILTGDGGMVEYKKATDTVWTQLGTYNDPNSTTGWYNSTASGLISFQAINSGWNYADYYLGLFNNEIDPVQFRFRIHSNATGALDGWAIDNFNILLPKIQYDAAVKEIVQPGNTIAGGTVISVEIKVKNEGFDTLYSIPSEYEVNGTTIPEVINFTNGLLPDSTYTHMFATPLTSPLQDFTIYARVNVMGDSYTSNNELSKLVQVTTPALDAAVDSISPNSAADISALHAHYVTVWFSNKGTTPITSIDLQYTFGGNVMATETWTGTALNQGDFASHTFAVTFSPNFGSNLICGKTLLANDANTSNDEHCEAIIASGLFDEIENGFIVWQNIPNPADNTTMLMYEIPTAGKVSIKITNVLGQALTQQIEDSKAGRHQIDLDVSSLANGVYYYTVSYDNQSVTRKMIVNR